MSSFPVPRTRLPALEPLLAGDLWRNWSEQGRVFPVADLRDAVRYVRLKPTASCRLAVFDEGCGTTTDLPRAFLLYLYPDLDRARAAYDKAVSRPSFPDPHGYEPFLAERHAVVAVPFPNDAGIPALRHVYRSYRLRRALNEVLPDYPRTSWKIARGKTRKELLAYKPGRRAVFRIDVVVEHRSGPERIRLPLHVKVENPAGYKANFAKLASIHAAIPSDAGWRVPLPRGKADSRGLAAAEWIHGQRLDRIVSTGPREEALRATGKALAGLHRIVPTGLGPAATGLDGAALRDLGDDLANLLPEHAPRIRGIAERLADGAAFLAASRRATVHGDFHLDQVLLEPYGPVLVDFDRAGLGHPLGDVGALLAHLEESGFDPELGGEFLEGYVSACGSTVKTDQLEMATAAALFRRAIAPFRNLAPDWPAQILQRLERVEQRVSSVRT